MIPIEQRRQHALGDLAVREHVGHAARHPQVVFEHDEAAVLQPIEIGARNRHVDVAVDVDAAHLAPVVPAALHQLARDDAFGEDSPLVIDVLEEQVDGGQPLREAALERPPLGRGDDARQQVEGKDPLGALLVAVDREGDALRQKGLVGLGLALAEIRGRRGPQIVEERLGSADGAGPSARTSRRTPGRARSRRTGRRRARVMPVPRRSAP